MNRYGVSINFVINTDRELSDMEGYEISSLLFMASTPVELTLEQLDGE